MKLVVELTIDYWASKKVEEIGLKSYYEDNFKDEDGVLLDEESEAIYYVTEVPQLPSEGQRVGCKFGTCIVEHLYYNLDEETEYYFGKTRIVVREE
jgi:hypothetical protein